NYEDILKNRNRTPLITYNQYRKEKKKKHKENAFHVDNWEYSEEEDAYVCPNGRKVKFSYHSKRTDRYGFTREFKVYEC
ncbi:IS5/IS1182 family transposase, partial [Oceanobacillus sp. APA_J-5(13-2)]|nr:IS5/IS1182 family transposase [Oceanobacillus alkalisoli]